MKDMIIHKPFDSLQNSKGKRIVLELINGKVFRGVLVSFDLNMNIVLEDVELEDGKKVDFVFLRSIFGAAILADS